MEDINMGGTDSTSQHCATSKEPSREVTPKCCSKCSATAYCSHECQKIDWKSHKKTCNKRGPPSAGPPPSPDTELSPPRGLDLPTTKPFTRLENGT